MASFLSGAGSAGFMDFDDVEFPTISRCSSPSFDDLSLPEPAYLPVEPVSEEDAIELVVCDHLTEEPESYIDEEDEPIDFYAPSRWSDSNSDTLASGLRKLTTDLGSSSEESGPSTPSVEAGEALIRVAGDETPLWGFVHTASPPFKQQEPIEDWALQYPPYLSTEPAQNGWGTTLTAAAPRSAFHTSEQPRQTFYAKRSGSRFSLIKKLTQKNAASEAPSDNDADDEDDDEDKDNMEAGGEVPMPRRIAEKRKASEAFGEDGDENEVEVEMEEKEEGISHRMEQEIELPKSVSNAWNAVCLLSAGQSKRRMVSRE